MEIQKYIDQIKNLYTDLLLFIQKEEYDSDAFKQIINNIQTNKIQDNRDEIENYLRLIINICNGHNRNPGFFDRIKQILQFFEEDIKKSFSNLEIFKLFESNKMLLLHLFEKKILVYDDYINKIIENKAEDDDVRYFHFFLPEIIEFQNNVKKINDEKIEKELKSIEMYEEKRHIGENDSYICSLIRQDSIDEFIQYVNQTNLPLTSKIERSIFETNLFLMNHEPTLIEYAAFFGSIKIFQYLRMNNIEFEPSSWPYAIHSNNAEIVNFLEEKAIDSQHYLYETCFSEAINCHHNDIATYIWNNFLTKISSDLNIEKNEAAYKAYNYEFFPDSFEENDFFFLCQYDYKNIINRLLESKKSYIEAKIIFFLNKFNEISISKN